jgi:hypothetical protein
MAQEDEIAFIGGSESFQEARATASRVDQSDIVRSASDRGRFLASLGGSNWQYFEREVGCKSHLGEFPANAVFLGGSVLLRLDSSPFAPASSLAPARS